MHIAIVDIDGTLADFSHRLHFLDEDNWNKFLDLDEIVKDEPILTGKKCEQFKHFLSQFDQVHFVTGRQESQRQITYSWLKKYYDIDLINKTINFEEKGFYKFMELYMRPNGELSTATQHKERAIKDICELYENNSEIDLKFMFFDDDKFVLNLYSRYGIALKAPECWNIILHDEPEGDEPLWNK